MDQPGNLLKLKTSVTHVTKVLGSIWVLHVGPDLKLVVNNPWKDPSGPGADLLLWSVFGEEAAAACFHPVLGLVEPPAHRGCCSRSKLPAKCSQEDQAAATGQPHVSQSQLLWPGGGA